MKYSRGRFIVTPMFMGLAFTACGYPIGKSGESKSNEPVVSDAKPMSTTKVQTSPALGNEPLLGVDILSLKAQAIKFDGLPVMIFGDVLGESSGPGNMRTCLDLSNGESGASVALYYCDTSKPYQWWIIDYKHSRVRSQKFPDKCLGWQGQGYALKLTPCSASNTTMNFNDNGTITNAINHCLDMRGNSAHSGAAVIDYPCWDPIGDNQKWALAPYPTGYIQLISPNGEVLDTESNKSNWGKYARLYNSNNQDNQYWHLEAANDGTGAFFIRGKRNGYCLDAPGANSWIEVWPCKNKRDDSSQKWVFEFASAASTMEGHSPNLKIRNVKYNACLVLPTTGSYPYMDDCSNPAAVAWRYKYPPQSLGIVLLESYYKGVRWTPISGIASCLAPSTYNNSLYWGDCRDEGVRHAAAVDYIAHKHIRFRATGKCLDLYGFVLPDGKAAQYDCNDGVNQRWTPAFVPKQNRDGSLVPYVDLKRPHNMTEFVLRSDIQASPPVYLLNRPIEDGLIIDNYSNPDNSVSYLAEVVWNAANIDPAYECSGVRPEPKAVPGGEYDDSSTKKREVKNDLWLTKYDTVMNVNDGLNDTVMRTDDELPRQKRQLNINNITWETLKQVAQEAREAHTLFANYIGASLETPIQAPGVVATYNLPEELDQLIPTLQELSETMHREQRDKPNPHEVQSIEDVVRIMRTMLNTIIERENQSPPIFPPIAGSAAALEQQSVSGRFRLRLTNVESLLRNNVNIMDSTAYNGTSVIRELLNCPLYGVPWFVSPFAPQ